MLFHVIPPSTLFQCMISGSNIAKVFPVEPSKFKFILNHELAPYFYKTLNNKVSAANCFVICFEESLNNVTQLCEIDLMVHFFDQDDRIKTRFWGSTFLGHATNADFLKHFSRIISSLDLSKMCQAPMYGFSVNLNILRNFIMTYQSLNSHTWLMVVAALFALCIFIFTFTYSFHIHIYMFTFMLVK